MMIKIKTILNKIYSYSFSFIHRIIKNNDDILTNDNNYTNKIVLPTNDYLQPLKKQKKPNFDENKIQKNKKILLNWISSFNHTHFLTVQFPDNMKTSNLDISIKHLKNVMANFEYYLLGNHWKKKHLFFMAFAEKGKNEGCHYHILFNSGKFTKKELQAALNKTEKKLKLLSYTFCLETINTKKDKVYSYCTKEIKIKSNGTFSMDNIISSNYLFDIDVKTPSIES